MNKSVLLPRKGELKASFYPRFLFPALGIESGFGARKLGIHDGWEAVGGNEENGLEVECSWAPLSAACTLFPLRIAKAGDGLA